MDRRTDNRDRTARASLPGFTLIELMVSMALVLVIILGVNAIFKMASDTVNAGQALGAANQVNRAAQSVVYDDVQNGVFTDGPLLLIRSERVAAFRNKADEQGDRDFNPSANPVLQDAAIRTTDIDGNNREGEASVRGEVTEPLIYNSRNHRIDRLAFFASHLFRRQTGTESGAGARFVDEGASTEAYIWYGHLSQPDFKTPESSKGRFAHRGPGETPRAQNPNNYYATDWILGRSVILLREQPPPGQNYIEFSNDPKSRLTPLSPDSQSAQKDLGGVNDRLPWSRYDMARTSINAYKGTLQFDIAQNGIDINGSKPAWYEVLGGEWDNAGNARFQGYPYPDRPLTAYGVARTVPVFVRGCTQFIVEYAGDYLKQDPVNGAILDTYLSGTQGTDGELDFVMVPEQTHPSEPSRLVRQVRWYGMPRNTNTIDDTLAAPMIRGALGADKKGVTLYDVIPLRDLLALAPAVAGTPVTIPPDFFEHFENLEPRANYAAAGVVGDPKKLRYYAAWGPDDLRKGSPTRPKMLRVTMTVDDPNGRLSEGQTYEYVMTLP